MIRLLVLILAIGIPLVRCDIPRPSVPRPQVILNDMPLDRLDAFKNTQFIDVTQLVEELEGIRLAEQVRFILTGE